MSRKLILVFCGLSIGCAGSKPLTFQPRTQPEQLMMYEQGLPKIGSSGAGSVVIVKPGSDRVQGKRAKFVVAFTNNGKAPFDVSPSSVSVLNGVGAMRVYSYEELVAEEEAAKARANNLAAFSTLMAGTAQILATTGGGSMMMQTQAAQARAQASQAVTLSNSKTSEVNAALKQYEDTVLRRTTLMPGMTAGGFVYFDIAGPGGYTIKVAAGGDEHEFQFDAVP